MTPLGEPIAIPADGLGGSTGGTREIVEWSVARQFSLADASKALHMTGGTAAVFTIPPDTDVNAEVGTEVEVLQRGAGAVSVQAGAGVTINGVVDGSISIAGQFKSVVARKESANSWIVLGDTGGFSLPVYRWDDIFTDHTGTTPAPDGEAGLDWTGFGSTDAQPFDQAFEWFMENVVGQEAPDGAIIDLTPTTGNSPGTMYLKGRVQPPPASIAKNYVIDCTGNTVLRGYDGATNRYGQWFLWGLKSQDPAIESEAVVDVDAPSGQDYIILRDDADATAMLNAAVFGSIVEIRTDKTAPNFHPLSSRATMFVQSVDVAQRRMNFTQPLPIPVPRDNNVNSSFETSDPSTVTMLKGGLLAANAPKGGTTITLASSLGLNPGDWLLIETLESTAAGDNQWIDGVEPNFDGTWPDMNTNMSPSGSDVQVNQEMHQVASVAGNTVTLTSSLGKNKLMSWQASATQIDPIDGMTLRGGAMEGAVSGGPSAWEHQYIWARFIVNSIVEDMEFDNKSLADLPMNRRRTGQACRFDSGDGNIMQNLTVSVPQRIDAGEGYGVSLRLGCRNTVLQDSFFEGCRHAIEFWGSSGGNIVRRNRVESGTSSCIDTHGAWNTGILITENYVTRDQDTANALRGGSGTSGDIGDNEPDAIRIGNNKFVFDEDVQVIDNTVENYDGSAYSIVPGVNNVTCDGLTVSNVYRLLHLHEAGGSRSGFVPSYDIVIRNVVCDQWRGRLIHAFNTSGDAHLINVLMENFELGATQGADDTPATLEPGETSVAGAYFSGIDNLTIRNFHIRQQPATDNQFAFYFTNIDTLVLDDVSAVGGPRGIDMEGEVTNVSGAITIRDITDRYLYNPEGGGNSGSLTVFHNQPLINSPSDLSGNASAPTEVQIGYASNFGGLVPTFTQIP
jgi:hypothetical protein